MHRLLTALFVIVALGLSNLGVAAPQSPQMLIEETSEKMLTALRENKETLRQDTSELYELVHEIVLPHFDFELMSRWVLGKHWREATPEQRRQFTDEFRTLLVRSYAGALLEYSDEEITFPPAPEASADDDRATVRSQVNPKGQAPIAINYKLRRRNGAWKVYDVSVDNVSLVINYRSTFDNQIRDEGMDAVISDLEQRNAKGA